MTQIIFIQRDGQHKTVEAENGLSLMVAAQDHQISGIAAICNGCCSCGTCLVSIAQQDHLAAPYSGELQVLAKLKQRESNSRLACQVVVSPALEGLEVRVQSD